MALSWWLGPAPEPTDLGDLLEAEQRTGIWLTPKLAARERKLIGSPGSSSAVMMFFRICS